MNFYPFATIFVVIAALLSCNGQQVKQTESIQLLDAEQSKDSIYSLSPFTFDGTVKVQGAEYQYSYTFQADTAKTFVTSSYGYKYYDNMLDLTITKDGEEYYTHRFTKQSFASHTDKEALKNYALLGFNFNYAKEEDHSKFHFIATVGDPDESGSAVKTFSIDITTEGVIVISPVDGVEEDVYNNLND